ncbi:uncharacterized protein STEHIDRAFT_67171 [Stereum hirsutum FP-91666 SS1]|uniref:uncharacterized protein n=1 Tax=Stereum hirsutum (strain FP-91666) TaxID=721885 RepID=UPI00044497E2|nr:uncharacterized protein STEHIDRAFT_67171 [Stereum hirsutum FP-91666 SS1]EIM81032.1 hypothetical protein STEHIDRAFT_67171 [Stereum hirsutum FP-91666 SS1]
MRHAEFRAVFEQFPWSRMESDGTFALDLYKARQSLLGSDLSFGYWRVSGGPNVHDIGFSGMRQLFDAPPELQQFLLTGKPTKHYPPKLQPGEKAYIHGGMMLEDSWPTDVEAWNLKDETWVPRLFFGSSGAANDDPPLRPEPGQVKDWKSWYEWRGLSLESPAALLMDAPLSTYHMLVNILKVADASGAKQQTLIVHYLGVETELNFLPLFSELALLLPEIHIEFTVFGKPAYDLVKTARISHPSSLATKDVVWSYTAPKRTGGGSINIRLYSSEEYWTRTVLGVERGPIKIPDAIIATNADLTTHESWPEAQCSAAGFNIPFAATEYAEQSLVLASETIPQGFRQTLLTQGQYMSPEFRHNLFKQGQRSYSVTTNPFHRPGARSGVSAWTMPNYYNGFVLPVVSKV